MTEFTLSPEEVATPGIAFQGGSLRLRPTLPTYGAAVLNALVGVAVGAVGVARGGLQMALVAIGVVLVAEALSFASVAVVAKADKIKIRNHLRSIRVPVDEIVDVTVSTRHFRWGKPPYSAPWNGPKDLLIGVIRLGPGSEIGCDALLGLPPKKDWAGATAPEIKTQALARWVAISQVRELRRRACE